MASEKWNYAKEMPDLSGRVAIVTGANSAVGIGYHTAQQLALRGAKVYLACRSESKVLDAIAQMKVEYPELKQSDRLHYLVFDLGDLKATKAAALSFQEKETRLDILAFDAFGAKFLRNFRRVCYQSSWTLRFYDELLPLIRRFAQDNSDVRIVNVASVSQLDAAFDPIDGAITSLFAATSPIISQERVKYAGGYLEPFGKLTEPSANARNEELAEQLWATSEKVVKSILA